MSEVLRLTLVSHELTEATRAARFPLDEPISSRTGGARPHHPGAVGRFDRVVLAPELRARQTAELLGLVAPVGGHGGGAGRVEPALRDLDIADWSGLDMAEVPQDGLMAWLMDPSAAPHGGESVEGLLVRVQDWMAGLAADPERGAASRVVAVTHPAVVRAAILLALGAPAQAFWRIDVEPLTRTTLHQRGPGWTLRATGVPLGGDEPAER